MSSDSVLKVEGRLYLMTLDPTHQSWGLGSAEGEFVLKSGLLDIRVLTVQLQRTETSHCLKARGVIVD